MMNQANVLSNNSFQASDLFDCFPPVFPVLKLVLLTFESFSLLFSRDFFFSVFGLMTDFSDDFDFFDFNSFSILSKLTSASRFLVLIPLLCFSSLLSDFFDDFRFSFSTFSADV